MQTGIAVERAGRYNMDPAIGSPGGCSVGVKHTRDSSRLGLAQVTGYGLAGTYEVLRRSPRWGITHSLLL